MKIAKSENIFFFLLLSVLFFFFSMNCSKENAEESAPSIELGNPQEEDKIILEIDDSNYFNSDFESYIRNTIGNDIRTLSHSSLSRLLDNFIEEKILLQGARNQNISLTWEEKKEYLTKLSNESWPDGKRISIDEVETKILFDRLLVEKYRYGLVKDLDVTKEEIEEYYNLHKKEFLRPERVRVSQILLKTEDKAIEVLERLKNVSEESFREIAREESVGVEASRGGKMGLFKMGQLPFEMEKIVFSLKEEELSQVMESPYGYHIFRLDKRFEPELLSEEEASPEIKIKILDQKIKHFMSTYITELKKNMEWSFYPQNLSFSYQWNSL